MRVFASVLVNGAHRVQNLLVDCPSQTNFLTYLIGHHKRRPSVVVYLKRFVCSAQFLQSDCLERENDGTVSESLQRSVCQLHRPLFIEPHHALWQCRSTHSRLPVLGLESIIYFSDLSLVRIHFERMLTLRLFSCTLLLRPFTLPSHGATKRVRIDIKASRSP